MASIPKQIKHQILKKITRQAELNAGGSFTKKERTWENIRKLLETLDNSKKA